MAGRWCDSKWLHGARWFDANEWGRLHVAKRRRDLGSLDERGDFELFNSKQQIVVCWRRLCARLYPELLCHREQFWTIWRRGRFGFHPKLLYHGKLSFLVRRGSVFQHAGELYRYIQQFECARRRSLSG